MSSAELTGWQAYEQVSGPLGPERNDVLAAMTAFYVLRGLGAKHVELKRLVPEWDRRRQSWQDIAAAARAMTMASGGVVNDPGSTEQEA